MSAPPRFPPTALEGFLLGEALKTEAVNARIRLVALVASLINVLAVASASFRQPESALKYPVMVIFLGLGLVANEALRRAARRERPDRRLLTLSAVLDTILVTGTLFPVAIWPTGSYAGVLALPHMGWFPLLTVTAGFRLSRGPIVGGALGALCGGAGLLLYDVLAQPERIRSSFDDYATYCILQVAALLVAFALAGRTRSLVARGAAAGIQAEKARQRLGIYVSEEVASRALEAETLEPGGERIRVAVLFCDLRGFTRYSERLPPERIVRELNDWIAAMLAEVRAEEGFVDKFIGDAVMVVFGVPAAREDDAARAVRCAARMTAALERHNETRARAGLPPLKQGIGVHYGEVVAGNVGTSGRLQFTVVGDVVNTASRLEAHTKELGVSVIVSAPAMDAARPFLEGSAGMAAAGQVALRGVEAPLGVYTAL